MKWTNCIILVMCLMLSSCAVFRNEAKRSIKKDVKEYISEPEGKHQLETQVVDVLDAEFNKYADKWHHERFQVYKERFNWTIGTVSIMIAILGGSGGLWVVVRKLKNGIKEV